MDLTGDEIAGVVDLFGALTREELGEALAELAYKRGEEHAPDAFGDDIASAVESYHLVRIDPENADVGVNEPVVVPGPGAFPDLPEDAENLVHIMDIDEREVDREAAGEAVLDRFREDAASAVNADDEAWVDRLLDVSYELEAWADVDLSAEREHLDDVA